MLYLQRILFCVTMIYMGLCPVSLVVLFFFVPTLRGSLSTIALFEGFVLMIMLFFDLGGQSDTI